MGAYLSHAKLDKESDGGENETYKYGASAMQGWRTSMEDAHTVVLDLDSSGTAFFAVYDGHGGKEVAKYCAKHLHKAVVESEAYSAGDLSTALTHAYLRMDEDMMTDEGREELSAYARHGKTEKAENVGESSLSFDMQKDPESTGGNSQGHGSHTSADCLGNVKVGNIYEVLQGPNDMPAGDDNIQGGTGQSGNCGRDLDDREAQMNTEGRDRKIRRGREAGLLPDAADVQLNEVTEEEDDSNADYEDNPTSDEEEEEEGEEGEEEDIVEDEWNSEEVVLGSTYRGPAAGCTAVCALVRGDQLIVANAGDSRCIISRNGKALALSEDHKPDLQAEKERILKAGGFVADGRINGSLNLSRAIGDMEFKQSPNLPPGAQIVTAIPELQVVTVTKEDEFLVLACDGIWDVKSSQQVVTFIRKRLLKNKLLSTICEELCNDCVAPDTNGSGVGTDNMSVVIVQFKKATLSQSSSQE
eukprot:jgi/Mesen1/920/ME000117S00083